MDWPAGASTYLVKSLLRYAICMHVQPYACMCMCMYNGSSSLKPLEDLSKKQQNPKVKQMRQALVIKLPRPQWPLAVQRYLL